MNSTKFTIFLGILGSLWPLEATVTDSPEDHDGRARICDIVYPCQPRPHSRIDSLLFCVKVILPDGTYRQVDFTDKVCLFNNRCKFGKHRVAYCHVGKCGSEYPPACEPGYENDSLGFDPRPRNCPTLPPSPPPLLPQPTPAPDWRPATIPPEWPSDRLPQPPPPPSQPPPPPQRPPFQPPPPPQRPPIQPPPPPQRPPFQPPPPPPTSEPPFQPPPPTWPTVGPPVNNPDDIFGTPSTPDRPKTTGPKPKPGQPSFPSIWDDYDIKDHPVAPHSLKKSSMDSSDDDWDDKESLG